MVLESGLFWYIFCLVEFSYLHDQGYLRRTAVDSMQKIKHIRNGLVPYVSSFLIAYLEGPSDTIYFTFLSKRKIAFSPFVASYNISWRTNHSRSYLIKLVRFCYPFVSFKKKLLRCCPSGGCVHSLPALLYLPAALLGCFCRVAKPAQ